RGYTLAIVMRCRGTGLAPRGSPLGPLAPLARCFWPCIAGQFSSDGVFTDDQPRLSAVGQRATSYCDRLVAGSGMGALFVQHPASCYLVLGWRLCGWVDFAANGLVSALLCFAPCAFCLERF